MKRKLFIIILNFNGGEIIKECLRAVRGVKGGDWEQEIVIVDNGSTDGSAEGLRVKVIKNKNNLGFGEGNNVGIKYALKNKADFILVLNPDAKVTSRAIVKMLRVAESDQKIGVVGPKILTPEGKIWSCGGEIDPKRYTAGLIAWNQKSWKGGERPKEVDFVSGTAMLIKKEVFEKAGFFDSHYFLYYEDVAFCQKAKKAGFKVVFTPQAVVYHQESSSVKKVPGLKEYYLARNHWLFLEAWAPLHIKLREMIRLPKTLKEHWQKNEKMALKGIRDYFWQEIRLYLVISWLLIAFGLYFLFWLFRFLEPWQKNLPVAGTRKSLKFLGRKLGLWF